MKSTPDKTSTEKPLVSIILPAYNEETILQNNIEILFDYLKTLNDQYKWEVLIINDGSKDNTGSVAESIAESNDDVFVYHHKVNRNLGTALRTGFNNSHGDYVVVLDIDLTYSPDHVGRLLSSIQESEADMVIASPYMKGGRNTGVPFTRLLLSKTVNFLMRKSSKLNIYTFTGMVRAYKGDFIRSVNTKSGTYDINSELILKAYILRARIVEIPAHLDWSGQSKVGKTRSSSLRIFMGILNGLANSFIFRPYAFFWLIGFIIFLVSLYIIIWIFINTFNAYPDTAELAEGFDPRLSMAVSEVFRQRPYAFIVGGTTLIISIQLLSLGFLSLQQKRYFDELFHLNSSIFRDIKKS